MNLKNPSPIFTICLVLGLTCISLGIISFWMHDQPLGKRIDFLSDIRENKFMNPEIQMKQDSILQVMQVDNKSVFSPREESGKLDFFFDAIESMRDSGGRTHIAYFGDSMIEGDLLTSEFRKKIQQLFGGNGVGFVPITSIVAGFRNTIHHEFNEEWSVQDFKEKESKLEFPIGPSGHVFMGKPGASVLYKATQYPFERAQLIQHPKSEYEIEVWLDQKMDHPLTPLSTDSNRYVVDIANQKFKSLELKCTQGRPILYGVNFEKGDGCYVDNFAFRGSTGTTLSMFNEEMISQISKELNYKLIIIQYGLNVIGEGVTDYKNYQRTMERTIEQLKKCFPKASFLIIGMSDKGLNDNGKWKSDPAVLFLLNHQIKISEHLETAFFSLYHSMGGEGSMVSWVNDSIPPLANKDYTHPNYRGANVLADSIFSYIERSYQFYQDQNKKSKKGKP